MDDTRRKAGWLIAVAVALTGAAPVVVAQDVYVAVGEEPEYYGCTQAGGFGTHCGQVFGWDPAQGAVLLHTLEDDSLGSLVALGADDAGNVYTVTDASAGYWYGADRGCLLVNGQGLAVLGDNVVDVDVAPDGTAWLATVRRSDDCLYDGLDCGRIYRFDPDDGLTLVIEYNSIVASGSEYDHPQLTGVAVDTNDGTIYATLSGGYEHQYSPLLQAGYLTRDGIVVATFDQFAIDVDVAPDGTVILATAPDEEDCYYGSGPCGGTVWTWDPSTGGAPTVLYEHVDPAGTTLSGVAVDGAGTWYFSTRPWSYYDPGEFPGALYREGVHVADFPAGVVDVDGAPFAAPAPVVSNATVFLASSGGDDCYWYGTGEDCSAVHSWNQPGFAVTEQLFDAVPDGLVTALAVDVQGNVFVTSEPAPYAPDAQGLLFRNGDVVATFGDDIPVDVDVGKDGRVYVASAPATWEPPGGTVSTWDAAQGLQTLFEITAADVGEQDLTGVAGGSDGAVYATTGDDSGSGGALLRDGVVIETFADAAVDVDTAPDGSVYLATSGDEYDCTVDGIGCGRVLRWTEQDGAVVIFEAPQNEGIHSVTGVAVDLRGVVYATAGGGSYDDSVGVLFRDGHQVAVLPHMAFDVDAVNFESHGTWLDLGQGLAGTAGVPGLSGAGPLLPGSVTSLQVTDGLADSTAALVLGASLLGAPFKGGTLVPDLDAVLLGLPLDAGGGLSLSFHWPPDLPVVTTVWLQCWVQDAGGPAGWAASNGLSATTP